MTSPSETASDHQAGLEDDQNLPRLSGHPDVTAVGSTGEEQGVAGTAPAAPPAADSARPGTRWPEIQAMFVDDPRSCLELAAGLVDDSVEALVASVRAQQQSLLHTWQRGQSDDPGTEEIRTAVQRYRIFWNRLEDFSRDL
jgi:hypothetical protein